VPPTRSPPAGIRVGDSNGKLLLPGRSGFSRLKRGTQAPPGTVACISIANLVASAVVAFAVEDRIAHYFKTGSAAGH
jgi:hypothetical protein